MPSTIQQRIKAEDVLAVIKKYGIKPQQEIILTFDPPEEPEHQEPPYEVPKKYPEDMRERVKRAKARAQVKKEQGYSRDKAFEAIYRIQDKISKNIEE